MYWINYINLEKEVEALFYYIHFSDENRYTYSLKTCDLLLRIVTEIESLSKDIYIKQTGTTNRFIKFDFVAINHLVNKLDLDHKKVNIVTEYCFYTNKYLYPFKFYTAKELGSKKNNYKWNDIYQRVKHNKINSLNYCTFEIVIEALAALYLLNLIFRHDNDIIFSADYESFDSNFDSILFNVQVDKLYDINDLQNIYVANKESTFTYDFDSKTRNYINSASDEIENRYNSTLYHLEGLIRDGSLQSLPEDFESNKAKEKMNILTNFKPSFLLKLYRSETQ